jgi:CRP/FNR family transcriptional regulator, anaerobic regulatory protein
VSSELWEVHFKQLGFSANEFKLSMSRQEIGNYLGLTIETVSRIFSRFQKKKYIAANRKYVRILEHASLDDLCKGGLSSSDVVKAAH